METYKIEITIVSDGKPYWIIEAIEEQLTAGEAITEYIIEEAE